jgi:3-deoxy-D-arabino-heptulosonate 7-phosphate (DAHP) synthase
VTTRGLQVDEVDKDSLTDLLRANTSRFEDSGFEVDQTRNTFRIVSAHWDVDSVAEVREEAFLDEIADRYADLVKIGHEIMLDAD